MELSPSPSAPYDADHLLIGVELLRDVNRLAGVWRGTAVQPIFSGRRNGSKAWKPVPTVGNKDHDVVE